MTTVRIGPVPSRVEIFRKKVSVISTPNYMYLSTLEPLRGENAVGPCPQREIKVPFRGFLSKFLTRTLVHVLTVPLKFRLTLDT